GMERRVGAYAKERAMSARARRALVAASACVGVFAVVAVALWGRASFKERRAVSAETARLTAAAASARWEDGTVPLAERVRPLDALRAHERKLDGRGALHDAARRAYLTALERAVAAKVRAQLEAE